MFSKVTTYRDSATTDVLHSEDAASICKRVCYMSVYILVQRNINNKANGKKVVNYFFWKRSKYEKKI